MWLGFLSFSLFYNLWCSKRVLWAMKGDTTLHIVLECHPHATWHLSWVTRLFMLSYTKWSMCIWVQRLSFRWLFTTLILLLYFPEYICILVSLYGCSSVLTIQVLSQFVWLYLPALIATKCPSQLLTGLSVCIWWQKNNVTICFHRIWIIASLKKYCEKKADHNARF